MPLHPNTQKVLRLLKFFYESGSSCTEAELKATEFWGPGWDIILEQDLIVTGFVEHDEKERRYTLTQPGKEYLDGQSQFDD